MPILTIPFTTPGNYTFDSNKIEVDGGAASLKLQPAQPFELYCKLDENTGLTAFDSSPNGFDGTFLNLTASNWAPGKINSAIEGNFIGVVTFGEVLAFNHDEPFSLECWVNLNSSGTYGLVSKMKKGVSPRVGYMLFQHASKLRFIIRDDNSNAFTVESDSVINDGAWNHVVSTYDGSSTEAGVKLYVNGVEGTSTVFSDTLNGDSTAPGVPFNIAGRDDNGDMTGLPLQVGSFIDEVAVYARELTQAEVDFRYNSGNGTQTAPGAVYVIDNPDIVPTSAIVDIEPYSVTEVTADTTETGSDEIRYAMVISGVDTWHDGASWTTSAGYAETNTIAEINAQVSTLLVDNPETVNVKCYLHSDDASTTPSISEFVITYEQFPTVAECVVEGFVIDNQGEPVPDVVVTARLTAHAIYNDRALIAINEFSAITDSIGRWEMSLVENASMEGNVGYRFCFAGNGVHLIEEKIVPNELIKIYGELEDL